MEDIIDKPMTEVRTFVSRLPDRAGTGLLVTPLLDILFLLLVFVLIGSSLLRVPGFEIQLPEVQDSRYSTADKLVITMQKAEKSSTDPRAGGSNIFFGITPIPDFNALENKLSNYTKTKSSGGRRPIIILRADHQVPFRDVATLMNICRRQGIILFIVTAERQGEIF